MHRTLISASLACLLSTTAIAQTATATGTGVGIAKSSSKSSAVAISGQGGAGGSSSSSLTINNPANTTSTVNQNLSGTTTSNINQKTDLSGTTTSNVNTSGTTTSNVNQSGTTTSNINQNVTGGTRNTNETTGTSTIKNVPGTLAPGLTAAGLETCLGSASGGGSIVGFGASFGTTVPDPGCNARLDARTLWSMGLKSAAVARLCIQPDIYRSMPDVCERYVPRQIPTTEPYNYGYPTAYRSAGGPIEVVSGKTGRTAMCDDYDETRQKCLKWTGQPRTKLATARKTGTTTAKVSSPPPAAVAAVTSEPPVPAK